jgi:hypothetical protein
MGLLYHNVEALVREHSYRPISGRVLMIGRQTVYFTPSQILKFLSGSGIRHKPFEETDLEIDRSTQARLTGTENKDFITDAALFRLLGVPQVLALDRSNYEGAEIVWDLTKRIPDYLSSFADFIVDGSTLDNIFDPAMAIRNFAEILKPGGRLLMTNMYSNNYTPYAILPPLWYLDYFVVNGFTDCKVYILVSPELEDYSDLETIYNKTNTFTIDLDCLLDSQRSVSPFVASRVMVTIVFAEKGPQSTSHATPVQQQYRSSADWQRYRENLQLIIKSPRPHIVRSLGDMSLSDVRGGHLFIANDFSARDPEAEIRRR